MRLIPSRRSTGFTRLGEIALTPDVVAKIGPRLVFVSKGEVRLHAFNM